VAGAGGAATARGRGTGTGCCARVLSHEDMNEIGKWWKNWWFKSKETMENIVKYRTMMKHGALSTHFFEPLIILNPGNHLDLIKKSWI